MFSIIYNDNGKDQTLATFKDLKQANKAIKDINKLFAFPLPEDLIKTYQDKAFIRQDNGSKFHVPPFTSINYL